MREALVAAASLFAVVAGTNDGSSILAAGLRVPGLRPVWSLLLLLSAIVLGPLVLFGTGVAATLAHGLVPFSGAAATKTILIAASSAMAVVFLLTRAGLPTSLTLGLVGAITGAGLGFGLPVSGAMVARVLLVGLAAPLLCSLLAFGLAPLALRLLEGSRLGGRIRWFHRLAFSAQCLAYSANGGQKMLAVFAVAAGATSGSIVGDPWWLAVAVAVLFGLGVVIGLKKVAHSLGRQILPLRSRHAVVGEVCSFAVVLGAGLAGVPLTMSQSVAGALVGAGAREARRRVRWPAALKMVGAWLVTLPASVALAAGIGLAVRWA